jgi:hypothetical protein
MNFNGFAQIDSCISSRPSARRPKLATTTSPAIAATVIIKGRCHDRTSANEMDNWSPNLAHAPSGAAPSMLVAAVPDIIGASHPPTGWREGF